MKFLLALALFVNFSAHAQLSVFATWNGDSNFEATLFSERDHCPSGFKAAAVGNKKAPYMYLGCWRLHANNQRVEITKTHKMDRQTLAVSTVKAEAQSVPISSFTMR
jgi:hypothetical protein